MARGDLVFFCPPLSIPEEDLAFGLAALERAVETASSAAAVHDGSRR